MNDSWCNNIHYMIMALSNIDRQKKAWLGKDPHLVSSYDEDRSLLFDSFEFDNFIKQWEIEKLNHELLKEFIIFRDELNSYNDKILNLRDRSDQDIFYDPDWLVIVNKAKGIIKKWDVL